MGGVGEGLGRSRVVLGRVLEECYVNRVGRWVGRGVEWVYGV